MQKAIDPWGAIQIDDYEKVFDEFGIEKIPDSYKKELNHFIFERKIAIGQRDLKKVYQRILDKKPFINMTGIATSGYLHLGHKLIIDIFKLFKNLGARNFFAICDIDGYSSRPNKTMPSMREAKKYAIDNLAHVLALGLDKEDIYVQSQKPSKYYEFAFEISKKITENMYKAIYTGKSEAINFGKFSAVILQLADILHGQIPAFGQKMPSITCIALEQDPHLRLVRDMAKRLPYDLETPSAIYIRHQSGLLEGKKMSSSEPNSAIFLNDTPKEAKKKIQNAFTGGKDSLKEQKELGGDPDICKVYELLKFHYKDDDKLKEVYKDCRSGKLLCGNCKKFCIDFVSYFLSSHHKKLEKTKKIAQDIIQV